MPESAPLDVSEATVGYELDSITLRDIASVRYVRHHEWLDHLLGSPLPISSIIPPKVTKSLNEDEIETRTKQLEQEIADLESEKQEGWKFNLDENKAQVLSNAIRDLREKFGTGTASDAQETVEKLLGVKMVESFAMRPVTVTYDRQSVEKQQARAAREKQEQQEKQRLEEEEAKAAEAAANQPDTLPNVTETDAPGTEVPAAPAVASVPTEEPTTTSVAPEAPTPIPEVSNPMLEPSPVPVPGPDNSADPANAMNIDL